jgi:hypothetical protein
MSNCTILLAAAALCCSSTTLFAAEGSSIAGPIGGTDIRSAQLPPPGLYGGLVLFYAEARRFFDGSGNAVPELDGLHLMRKRAGPFLLYVPDVQVFGGSIGIGGILPAGTECGRLFETTPKRCIEGIGDPYVELGWSRFFGTIRPSLYPDAYPVAEGLTVALGLGAVIPLGRYDAADAATQGLTIGHNVWDIAPTVAFTYTTKPLFADGTELSAKAYWNNYLENPDTSYKTGSIINVDFAVSERFGDLQVGMAGVYAVQVSDDKYFGARVPPDGRQGEALSLGAVLAYDFPKYGASLKVKALTTVRVRNSVESSGVAIGWAKKF